MLKNQEGGDLSCDGKDGWLGDAAGIAATPGPDFDPVNGRSYIRFSFAGDTQVIDKAMSRLEDWLPGLK